MRNERTRNCAADHGEEISSSHVGTTVMAARLEQVDPGWRPCAPGPVQSLAVGVTELGFIRHPTPGPACARSIIGRRKEPQGRARGADFTLEISFIFS